jgi:histidine triad (HIT) family protein
MEDCLFCKIANKENPAKIVFENDHAVAFLDVNPRSPGHTMVISKYHSRNLFDLPEEELSNLFAAVQRVARRIEGALRPDGFSIGINHGAASGQEVDHLHVHIMPRFYGDNGREVQSLVHNPPKESLEDIAEKIRTFANNH